MAGGSDAGIELNGDEIKNKLNLVKGIERAASGQESCHMGGEASRDL